MKARAEIWAFFQNDCFLCRQRVDNPQEKNSKEEHAMASIVQYVLQLQFAEERSYTKPFSQSKLTSVGVFL